jgi:hypothetical protein
MAYVDSPDFMYGIELLPKAIDIVESSLTGQFLFETGRKLLHLPFSKVLFETEERSFIFRLGSTTPVTSSTLGCSDS